MTGIEDLYDKFLSSTGICTDTRNITEGSLFFALKGENFNGNDYAQQALDKGCSYAVVDEESSEDNPRFVDVIDSLKALQELAKYHRKQLATPIIALTGSNGKTTTKELMHKVLASKYNVLATSGNLNNHIGVPLTLLRLKKEHELAIIEMGANHQGEIEQYCQVALPNYGLITNIGLAHLEGFGGEQGVLKGKSELFKYIDSKGGTIFFNSSDPKLNTLELKTDKIINYGTKGITGELLASDPKLSFKYVDGDYQSDEISTQLVGGYNFINMLAAICVGRHFDVDHKDIENALTQYTPDNNRSQLLEGKNKLVLDAYNANPSSMKAALQNFANMDGDKLCILGDMLELGEVADDKHTEIYQLTRELGLDSYFVGPIFSKIGANESFPSTDILLEYIIENPQENRTILIKGSRGMRLERLVDLLK